MLKTVTMSLQMETQAPRERVRIKVKKQTAIEKEVAKVEVNDDIKGHVLDADPDTGPISHLGDYVEEPHVLID